MKLHEVSYNEKQWKVHGSRSTGYKLVNIATLNCYIINGGIVGMIQISDDTFLVCYYSIGYKKVIKRFKFIDGKASLEYSIEFSNYAFLTEDIIIFDIDKTSGGILYSITKNQEIHDLNHLIGQTYEWHDVGYISNRQITLVYRDDADEYPSYLLLDYKLRHTYRSNEHLQLLIDPISFKPVAPVYSTLRDKFITLDDSITLKSVVEEENHYLQIIDAFLQELYNTDNTKSPDELLSMVFQNK